MSYDITQGDIIAWVEQYDGPLFHALLCDPPYHLTSITKRFGKSGAPAQFGRDGAFARASRGFMGKDWDGGDIAFRPETWATLGRVLHPGAFGMAFASTRGFHRMAVAIEDAGFIIHPMIMAWAFGCLSEDTEILTRNGWEPYHKAIEGTDVLCYNTDCDALEWQSVQELYVYAYDDTAYHIQSDCTDQIVSRNHRCLVERGGKFVFRFAETLQREEVVPVLAGMSDLRKPLFGREQRSIPQAALLLERLRIQGNKRCEYGQAWADWPTRQNAFESTQRDDHNVSGMRIAGMESGGLASQGRYSNLFKALQRRVTFAGISEAFRQRKGKEAARQGLVGRAQSCLEGWSNLLQDTWQLYRGEIRSLSSRVYQHGSQGWLCNGASATCGTSNWASVIARRSGTSYRPQSSKQRVGQLAAICEQSRPQVARASRVAASSLARVTPIHYKGVVWCVRVPTGAFVARRNGKVFITGNSGFPKATRIDTQIDRLAGAERQTVGQRKQGGAKFALTQQLIDNGGFNDPARESFDVTAPATELAQAFAGHRYGLQALKPALEPIIVFQKPYQGRSIDCITRTGAGAINIDAGRIGTSDDTARTGAGGVPHMDDAWIPPDNYTSGGSPLGRWPSNLILSHHPDCNGHCVQICPIRRLGEQSGKSVSRIGASRSSGAGDGWGMTATGAEYDDSGTATRYFYNADWMLDRLEDADPLIYQAKASTVEREAGLEGFTPTTVDDGRAKSIDNAYLRGETQRLNIHPTVKPISLARHLATLLLPPVEYAERRLFIPFAGVASEMIGAMLARWEHVQGVELDAQHIEIARARLAYWQQRQWELMNPARDITVKVTPDAPDGQLTLF